MPGAGINQGLIPIRTLLCEKHDFNRIIAKLASRPGRLEIINGRGYSPLVLTIPPVSKFKMHISLNWT
jgi:hypothetical protein